MADAAAAAEAGADALGLNFVSGPRRIDPRRGRDILQCLPPMVSPVALVRLENGTIPAPVSELLGGLRVSHLQVYGAVSRAGLAGLARAGFCVMPVVAVKEQGFAEQVADWIGGEPGARPRAIVLDAFDPAREGGTGKAFRWEWVAAAREAGQLAGWPPIILAGGLNPDNVAHAIGMVQPYGVDVSSGVEVEGSPGRKDVNKLRAFVRNALAANPDYS